MSSLPFLASFTEHNISETRPCHCVSGEDPFVVEVGGGVGVAVI